MCALTLDSLSCRTVRNQCLLFRSHLVYSTVLQHSERTKAHNDPAFPKKPGTQSCQGIKSRLRLRVRLCLPKVSSFSLSHFLILLTLASHPGLLDFVTIRKYLASENPVTLEWSASLWFSRETILQSYAWFWWMSTHGVHIRVCLSVHGEATTSVGKNCRCFTGMNQPKVKNKSFSGL